MRIQIQKEDEKKLVQETGTGKTFYYQTALLHLDGYRFPQEMHIPLQEKQDTYKAGTYMLSDSAWSINRFKNIEYNRFDFALIPFNQDQDKKAA